MGIFRHDANETLTIHRISVSDVLCDVLRRKLVSLFVENKSSKMGANLSCMKAR